jgi:superfamily II DNA or RNA helicase
VSKALIQLDSVIRLPTGILSQNVIENVQDILTIPNRERIDAMKQQVWGAKNLPEYVTLYEWDGADIILPRGFYQRLIGGFDYAGIEYEVVNNMTRDSYDKRWGKTLEQFAPTLRDYQEVAVKAILYHCQGIYQAPTGSGKTVTMLEAIRRASERTLVIVNKKELVQQWIDRSKEHLNFQPGFIGDGRWEEQIITVATQQTLWSRRDEIEPEWWKKWGFVVLDECHAVQADTYHEVMERFSAMYRLGVSATPKKTGDFKIADSVLGPIIHSTPKKPLRERGYLVQPRAIVVPTDFHYEFKPDKYNKKTGRITQRNNWHDVVARLAIDPARNTLIANKALEQDNRAVLVLSKRLIQLEQLYLLLQDKRQVLLLRGEESLDERMSVYEKASHGDCIILSTLADEAVDIPRIDTLFLIWPTKNTDLIRQQIGRGERPHPDKNEFLIYDFVDFSIPPIKRQYRDRRNFVYRPEEIDVTKLERK